MQRSPIFASDEFIYWKNRFETYVKSKDLDLWHVITHGDFQPIGNILLNKKNEIVPFDKLSNSQVKENKIDLLVQQYEQFTISEDESIDNAFARFNTIITSLEFLDEGYSSKNYVRKFFRALHSKWRAKIPTVKGKGERMGSLSLNARKESSDEESSASGSKDEEYAMAARDFKTFFKRRGRFVRQPRDEKKSFQRSWDDKNRKSERKFFRCGDPNNLIRKCPNPPRKKNQRDFVGGSWRDSSEEDEEMIKDETCLMAQVVRKCSSHTNIYTARNT
ncbi:hypothetical protein Tco_1408174 [Tanacetum coccineum]